MSVITRKISQLFTDASLGQKISLLCVILVVISNLGLGFIAYTAASNAIEEDIKINLVGQANDWKEVSGMIYSICKSNTDSYLKMVRDMYFSKGQPKLIDGKIVFVSGSNQYVVNGNFDIVDDFKNLTGGAVSIFQIEGDQAVRVSTNVIGVDGKRALGTKLSQPVYDTVVIKGETFMGPAEVVGKKYIAKYEPMKDSNGKTIGVLAVAVDDITTLGMIREEMVKKKIGTNGYMYVLKSDGMTLIHPTDAGKNNSDKPFVKEIITQKEGYLRYTWNGSEKAAGFAYYEPLDWIIVASSVHSDFTGPIDTIRNAIILVIILGSIGGSAVAIWFGRSISRRMNELVNIATRVTNGELSARSMESVRKDEIGILTHAFGEVACTVEAFRDEIQMVSKATEAGNLNVRGNPHTFKGDYASIIRGVNNIVDAMAVPVTEAMRLSEEFARGNFTARVNPDLIMVGDFILFKEALNKIGTDVSYALSEIKNQMLELIKGVEQVIGNVDAVASGLVHASKNVDDVSESSGQVAKIANTVSTLADQSGQNTNQILTAMKDLSSTVSSVAGKMEEVSILTDNAATLSTQGKDKAVQAETGMQGILHSSAEIEKMITDINSQMGEIGRIVDIIGGIAEQTNLLALNAAIEAARAGDAGLGFAVVAGEVKELAGGSQKSTENIGEIIRTLQKKTDAIAETVKISLFEVRTGSTAVGETLVIFNQIVESITDINRNMNEVAAASEEQAASVEEVTATIHEFGTMIQQTAKESISLAEASKESSSAVEQIVAMIQEVTVSMNQIRAVVTDSRDSVAKVNEEMNQFQI